MLDNDRSDLLRIWNDSAEYDPLTAALLEEKIEGDPDVDLNLCVVAESDNVVVGFGIGVVRQAGQTSSNTSSGFIKMLAVEPAKRRQGIGRSILKQLEAELIGRGVTSIRFLESAPNYLTPGIDVRYSNGIEFAENLGYERVGEAHNLVVDLRERVFSPPTHAASSETDVRRATPDDAESARDFLNENFWPGWAGEVMAALDNLPPTLYLAFRGQKLVGFAAYDANNKNTGWFGPMGVEGSERQTGIGGVLLLRCLCDIQAQGHEMAIIPWVDAIPFYTKTAAAKVSRRFARYEKKVTI